MREFTYSMFYSYSILLPKYGGLCAFWHVLGGPYPFEVWEALSVLKRILRLLLFFACIVGQTYSNTFHTHFRSSDNQISL